MSQRPKILIYLASMITAVVLSVPIQIFFLYEHDITEIQAVMDKITILNWLMIGGGLFTAALIINASPWVRYAAPALMALVAANNFLVGHYGTDFTQVFATMATLSFLMLNAPLAAPEIRQLFREPQKRWWLHANRKRLSVPVFVGGARDAVMRAKTYDVSETGAFIPLASIQDNKFVTSIPTGGYMGIEERILVCLNFGLHSQVRCEGRVVRRAPAKGNYPAGIAVQFVDMPQSQRRELRRYLNRGVEASA